MKRIMLQGKKYVHQWELFEIVDPLLSQLYFPPSESSDGAVRLFEDDDIAAFESMSEEDDVETQRKYKKKISKAKKLL
jgi:hypothetical protein